MNIIEQLFDQSYVKKLFSQEVLPLYPDFIIIEKIKIHGIKKLIWEKTYHVVIKFDTTFLTNENKKKTFPIYCSAHSSEPRKNVYQALKFLWENGFARGNLSLPRPLFYSDYFRGTFYRGVVGENLYHFIREKNFVEIEPTIVKAAAWFAKLHQLPTERAKNFNPENSRISTVIPGMAKALDDIKIRYGAVYKIYETIYKIVVDKEESFLNSTSDRWLVHGDAHPENIIKVSRNKLAVIDFTDICLADFTRDLGSFLQQLEYMCNRKIDEPAYADKIKKLFLDSYLGYRKITLTDDLSARINNYYHWTTLRTATFFLLKDKAEPKRSEQLISKVSSELNIAK